MPVNYRYIMFLACTAALGGLLFGFDIAIITGAGPFILRAFALGDLGLGWAFSSLLFGCVSVRSSPESSPTAMDAGDCSSWLPCYLR